MMTIQQIYDLSIAQGIKADVRGAAVLQRRLKKLREKYEKMSGIEKEVFDMEDLTNPFPDSRMYAADPRKQVKRVLSGIDLEVGEVLLADRLRERGQEIDLLLFHHPIGAGLSDLSGVMDLQVELLAHHGIPINAAQAFDQLLGFDTQHRQQHQLEGVALGEGRELLEQCVAVRAARIDEQRHGCVTMTIGEGTEIGEVERHALELDPIGPAIGVFERREILVVP